MGRRAESGGGAQGRHFIRSQGAAFPPGKAAELDGALGHAHQTQHGQSQVAAHAPDLAVDPLDEAQGQKGAFLGLAVQHLGCDWGQDIALGQAHPPSHGGQDVLTDLTANENMVDLGDMGRWMGEPVGEFPVIGEKQEPLGIVIQASDREQALAGDTWRQEIEDRGPSLGVGGRGHGLHRLVEKEIDVLFLRGKSHFLAVYDDIVPIGVDFDPWFAV